MTARRRRAQRSAPPEFLYVPRDEMSEALGLGSLLYPGEARLVKPRPLPDEVHDADFARWQTPAAKYRWLAELIGSVFGESAGIPDADEALAAAAGDAAAHDRVYLWVLKRDIERVKAVGSVRWDRRRRMLYALPGAKLDALFRWLTPTARAEWEAERATDRMTKALIQQRALEEWRRHQSEDSEEVGAVLVPTKSGEAVGADDSDNGIDQTEMLVDLD